MGVYLGYVPRVGCRITAASFVVALDEFKGQSLSDNLPPEDAWKPYVNITEEYAVLPPDKW
eukprot:5056345-Prorocentrum_lima.AAC.1